MRITLALILQLQLAIKPCFTNRAFGGMRKVVEGLELLVPLGPVGIAGEDIFGSRDGKYSLVASRIRLLHSDQRVRFLTDS